MKLDESSRRPGIHALSRHRRTGLRLKDIDPSDTGGLKAEDKPQARRRWQTGVNRRCQGADMLYAQDRWAVLLIFPGDGRGG